MNWRCVRSKPWEGWGCWGDSTFVFLALDFWVWGLAWVSMEIVYIISSLSREYSLIFCRFPISFPNNIHTPLSPNPHLMHTIRIYIPPRTGSDRCLAYGWLFCTLVVGVGVVGVCICQGAAEDEMCCFGAVFVGWVVGVGLVCPGEDVAEAPGADIALCFFLCACGGHGVGDWHGAAQACTCTLSLLAPRIAALLCS